MCAGVSKIPYSSPRVWLNTISNIKSGQDNKHVAPAELLKSAS